MKPPSPGETPLPAEVAEVAEKETVSSGFAELLRIPEGSSLPPDKRKKLQTAANKIVELIYSPLRAGENTLSKEDISNTTRELFEEPVKQARETLELFESIVRDLKGNGENAASSVILAVKQKTETETVFLITPNTKSPDYEKGQVLGQIGERNVRKVEIVVKTAEGREEQTYTPQTIKLIALNKKGQQIENVRIEVHSTEKREGNPQCVQVDADIGGERLAQTHLNVKYLGQGEEALNNFRLLQYAFVVNFAERVAVAAESSALDFENKSHRQRFTEIINQARHNLGLPVEAKKTTTEETGETSEKIIEDLHKATGNVSPALTKCLREAEYNLWGIEGNGIGDPDIILCALFELEPHELTKDEFISPNGKVPKAIEALSNFSTLKRTAVDEKEHIILARAGDAIFDQENPEVLIEELEKLATAQDIIAGKN